MYPVIERASEDLPVQRLCGLACVPRSSHYRAVRQAEPGPDPNEEVLREIRTICREMPRYGSPRVTAELRRRGFRVNHKRVFRLMAGANLRCRRKNRFVATTDSGYVVESLSMRPFPVSYRFLATWRSECHHGWDLEQSDLAPHPTRSGTVYLGAHLNNRSFLVCTYSPAVRR
jgi:HTH-like domain